ncbi:LysM peptidoglycan-binding domain-containing C40 family peptidase [Deinococcus sp.]|uniref:LysM peptidoglycan-binding domain-containing C40 family peptidase n=1 Tax=Deinococcus sp. TaxID=47478 RepID=UPI0025D7C65B|nr:LysM peptidoglycan-binding domain-containing C40 family peptidase [Deinococcus sp.]
MNAFKILLTLAALSTSASAATYTVSPGDTLTSVAQALNVEPQTLMKRNGLSSSTLQVGQKLNSGAVTAQGTQNTQKASAPAAVASTDAPVAKTPLAKSRGNGYVRTAALRFLGIRYAHGGTGNWGLDCSGYTMAVYRSMGLSLPRTAAAQSRSGYGVGRGELQAGDLMFFNTMGRGISHVAIYLGGGQFANANSYYGRTMIDNLSNPYWSSRYVSARRVL